MSSLFSFHKKRHQRTSSQTSGDSFTEDPKCSTAPNSEELVLATREFQRGDLGFSDVDNRGVLLKRKSRLAKTLADTLNSSAALPYFLQFMETRRVDHLLRFWLTAENFKASTRRDDSQSKTPSSYEDSKLSHPSDNSNKPPRIDSSTKVPSTTQCHKVSQSSSNSTQLNCHLEKSNDLSNQLLGSRSRSELLEKTVLEDAKNIYTKFICLDAQYPIGVTNKIRNEVVERICGENGRLDPTCFCTAQSFVLRIMEERYFPEYCKSVYHTYHQIDVLTSGTVYLSDIIYDTNALLSFNEFLEIEGALNYVQFLLCAENFAEDLKRQVYSGAYHFETAVADAMNIYDRYISMQAISPIGFPDDIRSDVENLICREGGPLPDCFDVPAKLIWRLLEERYLARYLESDGFRRYLMELRCAVQNHVELPPTSGISRRRTTAGSDISSSAVSTRSCPVDGNRPISSGRGMGKNWSMGDSRALKLQDQVQNISAEEVRLDAKRSSDPDSLWKRDSQSNLAFGHVDSLGQYVRKFEDEPLHHVKGSRLSAAMRKVVNPHKQDKEEEARKIAESIVAGITNMTAQIDLDESDF